MGKKFLALIGLIAVIALTAVFISYLGSSKQPDPAPTEEATDAPSTAPTQAPTESRTEPVTEHASENDIHGYGKILTSAGSYRVERVYDHVRRREATPREVFGKSYSSCYLLFRDGYLELCVNPSSGEIRRGTYHIFDDVISVKYQNGTGSEFNIITNSSGGIDSIIVNYGDYDVYFG